MTRWLPQLPDNVGIVWFGVGTSTLFFLSSLRFFLWWKNENPRNDPGGGLRTWGPQARLKRAFIDLPNHIPRPHRGRDYRLGTKPTRSQRKSLFRSVRFLKYAHCSKSTKLVSKSTKPVTHNTIKTCFNVTEKIDTKIDYKNRKKLRFLIVILI